jgi:tetratricopeptide (TPR) repeat protein
MPDYAWTYSNRGLAYYRKGDHDRAISDYAKALELDPNCAAAYHGRGDIYRDKGKVDLAIKDYKRYIELAQAQDAHDVQLVKQWLKDHESK